MTCLRGRTFSQNFSSLALTVCDLWYGGKGWLTESVNEWMNDEAVYRTAPATTGLFNTAQQLNIILMITPHICSHIYWRSIIRRRVYAITEKLKCKASQECFFYVLVFLDFDVMNKTVNNYCHWSLCQKRFCGYLAGIKPPSPARTWPRPAGWSGSESGSPRSQRHPRHSRDLGTQGVKYRSLDSFWFFFIVWLKAKQYKIKI